VAEQKQWLGETLYPVRTADVAGEAP